MESRGLLEVDLQSSSSGRSLYSECDLPSSGRVNTHATPFSASVRQLFRPFSLQQRTCLLRSVVLFRKRVLRQQQLPKPRDKHGSHERSTLFRTPRSTVKLISWVPRTTKIYLHEIIRHENFTTRKFPDLRYQQRQCILVPSFVFPFFPFQFFPL